MFQLDAIQLYDLSEAGRLLFRDPVRLEREARRRKIPAARVGHEWGVPAPWADAEAGTNPSDPEALCVYWLERLAPPSPDAHRPRRGRDRLPLDEDGLLDAAEAARRLFATPAALRRLDTEGRVPSMRLDGRPFYDAVLVDHVAREDEGEAARREADARLHEVLEWARFEYDAVPAEAVTTAAPAAEPVAPAKRPGAYEIPTDLDLGTIEPLKDAEPDPPSTLIGAEGFETIDED